MEQLTRHPLSALWGDMPEEQFDDLVESVRTAGIMPFVRTLGREVLDGWHRYKAALAAGVEPLVAEWHGDDPVAYVIRENALRRHLTPGQRAACIVACRQWAQGGVDTNRLKGGEIVSPPSTVAEMAQEAGVSDRLIQQAKVAEEAGLGDAVRSGEMPVHKAAAQARGATDKPKGPTLTERLEAQVDALQMEVHEKAQRIEGLDRELREARAQQSEYPHEREAVANEREAMISALRGSVNEWQTKHNDERRRANWWERQARSLGWQREGQAEPPDLGEEAEPPEFPIYEGWDGREHGEF